MTWTKRASVHHDAPLNMSDEDIRLQSENVFIQANILSTMQYKVCIFLYFSNTIYLLMVESYLLRNGWIDCAFCLGQGKVLGKKKMYFRKKKIADFFAVNFE